MAKTYNILNDEEMNEIIDISECRNLREIINILTCGCMITKREYVRLMVVIDGIMKRMEKESGDGD